MIPAKRISNTFIKPPISVVKGIRSVTTIVLALSLGIALTFSAAPSRSDVLKALPSLPAPLTDQGFVDTGNDNRALYELGRQLFFDPILSGNRNISCGTCHDPSRGTGDGVALSIGEGGIGIGPLRRTDDGVTGRIPRNAQSLYNIGARQYTAFFHDGRLSANSTHVHGAGFVKLDSERLPKNLDSLLAAQALFPVTSPAEMAGQVGENPVADAVSQYRLAGKHGAWDLLAERLRKNTKYVEHFRSAFAEIEIADDINFSHAARALAQFQSSAFRSTNSRFDTVLETRDVSDWSSREQHGLTLFYGKAGCSDCHSGSLLTDHDFHAIAMPQIGPGKGHGTDKSYLLSSGFADRLEDEGRYRATLVLEDLFRFRTPSLRNIALTGPWGHAGTYDTLSEVVKHHLDPLRSLARYSSRRAEAALPVLAKVLDSTGRGPNRLFHLVEEGRRTAFDSRRGFIQGSDSLRTRIARANELPIIVLSNEEVTSIVAFLQTLTDPDAVDQSHLIPSVVPSGLTPQPQRLMATTEQ